MNELPDENRLGIIAVIVGAVVAVCGGFLGNQDLMMLGGSIAIFGMLFT